MQTGSNATVDKPWQASFEHPARFRQGDPMFVTGESDLWDGQYHWIKARSQDQREAWVPHDLPAPASGRKRQDTIAARDFDPMELTCAKGEILVVLELTLGWALCRNTQGASGWVPVENLTG